jgi:hypothetical protein
MIGNISSMASGSQDIFRIGSKFFDYNIVGGTGYRPKGYCTLVQSRPLPECTMAGGIPLAKLKASIKHHTNQGEKS